MADKGDKRSEKASTRKRSRETLWQKGINRDITEQQEGEEKLRLHAQILEQVHDSIVTTDLDGIITSWNKGSQRMFGYTEKEALGKHISFIYPGKEKKFLENKIIKPLKKRGHHQTEVRLRRKSGEDIYVHLSLSLLKDANRTATGMIGYAIDITDRRRATEAIEAARTAAINDKNRLEAVMEVLPSGIAVVDEKGGNIQANNMFEKIWGGRRPAAKSIKDYVKFKAWQADTGKPVKPQEWASAQAVQKGKTVTNQLYKIQRFDGTYAFVLNSAAPIRNAAGKIIGSAVAILDITGQKKAEKQIESAAKFPEENPNPVMRVDCNGKLLYHNRAAKAYLGVLKLSIGELVPNQLRKTAIECLKSEKNVDLEISVSDRIFWLTFSPICAEGYINIYGRDITERKQLENALRRSAERYKSLAANVPSILMRYDKNLRVVYLSPRSAEITGMPVKDFIGKTNREVGMPKHLCDIWENAIREVFLTKQNKDLEFDFPSKGQTRTFYLKLAPEFGTNREVEHVLGISTDITELKKIEEALKKSNEELERFNRAATGRELRIIELKKEVNDLCSLTGQARRYLLEFEKEKVNEKNQVRTT